MVMVRNKVVTEIASFIQVKTSKSYQTQTNMAVVRMCSVKKVHRKQLCQNIFLNKVVGMRPATLMKNRPWHRCFLGSFVKFLRTTIFIEHLWWLLPN